MDTSYFLTGSVRVRHCPEVEEILARLRVHRDVGFEIVATDVEGGEIDLTIDGSRELGLHGMLRLEEQLQALGPSPARRSSAVITIMATAT